MSRLLLLSGASPDTIIDPDTQESLLSRFAAKGNVEMVRMLGVEFGGNTNIADMQVRNYRSFLAIGKYHTVILPVLSSVNCVHCCFILL